MSEPPKPRYTPSTGPPQPKYLTEQPARKRSMEHEDRLAKRGGGKRVKGSGSNKGNPGDIQYDDYLMEHKFTDAQSFSVSTAVLRQIVNEAFLKHKTPAFAVTFTQAPQGMPKDWVAIPFSEFEKLL